MADNEGLSLVDLVSGFRIKFKDKVKQYIKDGAYVLAKYEMVMMCNHLAKRTEEIRRYHSGDNCLGSVIVLKELLELGRTRLDLITKQTEGDLAQLELAIKSGNKFY